MNKDKKDIKYNSIGNNRKINNILKNQHQRKTRKLAEKNRELKRKQLRIRARKHIPKNDLKHMNDKEIAQVLREMNESKFNNHNVNMNDINNITKYGDTFSKQFKGQRVPKNFYQISYHKEKKILSQRKNSPLRANSAKTGITIGGLKHPALPNEDVSRATNPKYTQHIEKRSLKPTGMQKQRNRTQKRNRKSGLSWN